MNTEYLFALKEYGGGRVVDWLYGGSLVTKWCLTLMTPWTVAPQTPLSIGFPRQEYWSGLPFPSPGHLPHPGIKPASPALQVNSLLTESPGKHRLIVQMTPILHSICIWIIWLEIFNSSGWKDSVFLCNLILNLTMWLALANGISAEVRHLRLKKGFAPFASAGTVRIYQG